MVPGSVSESSIRLRRLGGSGERDGEGLETTEAEDGIEGDGDGGGMVTDFLGRLEGRGPCVAGFRFCERA